MHCAACALTIEDALRKVPGGFLRTSALQAIVPGDLVGSARATSRWMQAVQSAGYRPVPANDALAGEHRKKETRMALLLAGSRSA